MACCTMVDAWPYLTSEWVKPYSMQSGGQAGDTGGATRSAPGGGGGGGGVCGGRAAAIGKALQTHQCGSAWLRCSDNVS